MRAALATLTAAALALSCASSDRIEKNWQPSRDWPDVDPTFHVELESRHGQLPGNQLRYVVLPDPTATLVQLDVRVDVGAAEDPPGKRGLAHLVEHVMFLARPGGPGTPRLEALLRSATVSHNAYTSLDATHYQNLLRPEELPRVLALEATRFGQACRSVDVRSFERERDVVRNELRQRGGTGAAALTVLTRTVYGDAHPYASTPAGSDVEVAALTLDDVCGFVDAYYAPARLVVVLAGKVDALTAGTQLETAFAPLAARAGAPLARIGPAHAGGKRTRLEVAIDAPVLVWAYPLPGHHASLGTESQLLVDDLDAALRDRLYGDKRVTRQAVFVAGGERAPLAIVAVQPADAAHLDEVEKLVDERLGQLAGVLPVGRDRTGWLPTTPRLAHRYFMRLLFRLESLGARADLFADYLQLAPGASFTSEYARLVGHPELLEQARALYAPVRARRFLLAPEKTHAAGVRAATLFAGDARENKEDLDVDASEAHRHLPVPAPADALPEAHRLVLDNGMIVVLQPSPTLVPLVVARLTFAVGQAHEPAAQAGLAELAAYTFEHGAYASSQRLFDRVDSERLRPERLGLSGPDAEEEIDDDIDVSADTTTITVRFPANDAPDVFHDIAFRLNAFADPSTVDRLLRAWEHELVDAPRGLGSITWFAFAAAVFGPDHPYARVAGSTLRSILRIEREDVLAFLDRHYVAANATLVVTGAFDADALAAGITDEFGRWPAGMRTPPAATPARTRQAPLFLGVASAGDRSDQLEIMLGYPAPAGIDAQHAARLVLARMLELRAAALRERLGASYGFASYLLTEAGPGAYVVSGTVDAARAGESLALLRRGIAELGVGVGFDEDFARARRFVLAGLLARSSSPSAVAERLGWIARFGQDPDYSEMLARQVAALEPQAVHALVDADLAPAREVVVLTGPRAAVEKAYREAGIAKPRFMKRWPPPPPAKRGEGQ